MAKSSLNCVYCGNPVRKVNRGEHIVPAVLKADVTINELSDIHEVCGGCNGGTLALLDKELCSRSYLSIVASQQIDAHLWQVWDVDHHSRDALVEARPEWSGSELTGLHCYPQMTFESSGAELRADAEEALTFGHEDFAKVFVAAVRKAYDKHNYKQKNIIIFEKMESKTPPECRYPPRIFSRHSIAAIARKMNDQTFILRYSTTEDVKRAMLWLSRLGEASSYRRWARKMGSRTPKMACSFEFTQVLRALTKIAINLLAAYCTRTVVSPSTFRDAIRIVLGEVNILPQSLNNNGFVRASDVKDLSVEGCHSFQLSYHGGTWIFHASFFGGRIGAHVSFPGINCEQWNTLHIVAPLGSKQWKASYSSLPAVTLSRAEWRDIRLIAPSVDLQRVSSSFSVEYVPVARAANRSAPARPPASNR